MQATSQKLYFWFDRTGSSILQTTLTSWTDRLAITGDTAAILAKILQKRPWCGRWRQNRKWKYGGNPIFWLSDPDFLFNPQYIMGPKFQIFHFLWQLLGQSSLSWSFQNGFILHPQRSPRDCPQPFNGHP